MIDDGARWLVLTAIVAGGAIAAPFVPADDAQVLERLPGRAAPPFRELKSLQAAAAQAPTDVARATALARQYVLLSRLEGDPRFLGYAQAALAPWWNDKAAPTAVLVLRATILQSSHRFDSALADLATVLERDPRNAQALLTTATVQTVQGRYADAHAACERMAGAAPDIYRVICVAAIDSVTGKSATAYATLRQALATLPRVDGTARVWGETLLGEIAHRRGDRAAEAHFKAALATGEKDLYLVGAYADWLLDVGRAADVAARVAGDARVDPLLLRLALAQQAVRDPQAGASIAMLGDRFAASQARGDTLHQRENARFLLELKRDPAAALRFALANWQVQREAADWRILAEAALAANDANVLATVKAWQDSTGLEFPAIAQRLGGGAVKPR